MVTATKSREAKIVAGVIRDTGGRCLLVRKVGSDEFVQPGGAPLPGEDPLDTLEREIVTSLGCGIDRESAEFDGAYISEDASDSGLNVEASVYRVSLSGKPEPKESVAEIIWLDPNDLGCVPLDQLSKLDVLPRYQRWTKPCPNSRSPRFAREDV